MKIKRVCIVGAGSSGWMAAALLSKLCPHLEIAIVEDKNTKSIGVGESTLGHFNRFLQLLELKDEDWMPACHATYKNSIRFTNFREGNGESFEYPFSRKFDDKFAPSGMTTWGQLALLDPHNFGPETFAEMFTDNTFLAKYNRCTYNQDGRLRSFYFKYDTAYHLDADLFGQYLKNKVAIPHGVNVIQGHVTGCQSVSTSDSTLEYIVLDYERKVYADLYIDCTGFKSEILEKFASSQFISYDKRLLNDSAFATQIPYVNKEEEMRNVTDCHAMNNGWVWNIPLWNRIGTGYCYSSKFCTRDEAEVEFRKHLGERGKNAKLSHINIKHGRHTEAWKYNVVGIGLAYGFLEPLESTGLLTTHENLIHLAYTLNMREGYITQVERDNYNCVVSEEIDHLSDFIAIHYAFSKRTDTPYWKEVTQNIHYYPTSTSEWQLKYDSIVNWGKDMYINHSYPHSGVAYIAAGHGFNPIPSIDFLQFNLSRLESMCEFMGKPNPRTNSIEGLNELKEQWLMYRSDVIRYVQSLPTHYQFLKEYIYKGDS